MGEQEVIVAEFNIWNEVEVILIISEDELGNKYIEIPDKDIIVNNPLLTEKVISDYEVINNYYDEDGEIVE